ncbi:MAG: hypothetical protein M1823_003684 [Watsoniomyces obsoletus]|nr:MAG: hypothetical protein M1823_003684 [Watsoniomyces obsoletus]
MVEPSGRRSRRPDSKEMWERDAAPRYRSRSRERYDRRRDRSYSRDRERPNRRERDRDRREERREGREGKDDRSPLPPRHRMRSRSPRRSRSPVREPARERNDTPIRSVEPAKPKSNGPPERSKDAKDVEDADMVEPDDDDMQQQMQAMLGFGGFGTTKQKKVPGNDVYSVRKEKKTEYRQYMNRIGGFNRPLSPGTSIHYNTWRVGNPKTQWIVLLRMKYANDHPEDERYLPRLVGLTETLFSVLLGAHHHSRNPYTLRSLEPWRHQLKWEGLCSHSALKEGFTGLPKASVDVEKAHKEATLIDRRAKEAQYWVEYRDGIREQQLAWRARNPGLAAKRAQAWKKGNPEKLK